MIYTLKIYRKDRRCLTGMRLVGTYQFDRKDRESMDREVRELKPLYPDSDYRMEYFQ